MIDAITLTQDSGATASTMFRHYEGSRTVIDEHSSDAIGVAVIEDSAILRELIEESITRQPGLVHTGSAGNLRDAGRSIDWVRTGLATVDLFLPDGLGVELGARIRASHPHVRIVILSDHRRPGLLQHLSDEERPYWSYLLKTSIEGRQQLGELLLATARVSHIDPQIVGNAGPNENAIAGLSEQQRVILGHIARGLSNAAIARTLHLAEKSVEYHVTQIYQRLGILGDADANARVSAAVLYLRRFET